MLPGLRHEMNTLTELQARNGSVGRNRKHNSILQHLSDKYGARAAGNLRDAVGTPTSGSDARSLHTVLQQQAVINSSPAAVSDRVVYSS